MFKFPGKGVSKKIQKEDRKHALYFSLILLELFFLVSVDVLIVFVFYLKIRYLSLIFTLLFLNFQLLMLVSDAAVKI